MVAINDPQIPIYMHFLVELKQITIGSNFHRLVYIFITYPYFYFIIILKQRINLYLN